MKRSHVLFAAGLAVTAAVVTAITIAATSSTTRTWIVMRASESKPLAWATKTKTAARVISMGLP